MPYSANNSRAGTTVNSEMTAFTGNVVADTSVQDVTLNLVAYSTPRPVLDKLIEDIKRFAELVKIAGVEPE